MSQKLMVFSGLEIHLSLMKISTKKKKKKKTTRKIVMKDISLKLIFNNLQFSAERMKIEIAEKLVANLQLA